MDYVKEEFVMKKRWITGILCIAIAAGMLGGCASGNSQETTGSQADSKAAEATEPGKQAETEGEESSLVSEPVQMTLAFADGDENAKIAITEIANRFMEKYPNVSLLIVPSNGTAYNEFLKTKSGVGEFPEIVEMRDPAGYVRAGMLAPLPAEITSLLQTTAEFDGTVYTAALAAGDTRGIIYNKKYFEANELAIPKNWDEFIALCEKIEELGDMAPLAVGAADIWHMGYWFYKIYDDNVLSQDPDFIEHCYDGSADWTSPEVLKTFEQLKQTFTYAQNGWSSTPDAQMPTFLVNDMAAMLYSAPYMFASIESADPDFEMGWFPVADEEGTMRLVGGSVPGGWSISAEAAENPNKKTVGEEFIKFFFAPENYAIYCEALNAIPSTKITPEFNRTQVMDDVIEATKNADNLSVLWNNRVGKDELPPDFRNFTYKTLIEMCQGTKTVETASTEIAATWKTAMQSFNPITGVGIE